MHTKKKVPFSLPKLLRDCVYSDIRNLWNTALLFWMCLYSEHFYPSRREDVFFQYKSNLNFWKDNTFTGLNSKGINRNIMTNLSSTPYFSASQFPSLEAPHVISCLCILLENFLCKYVLLGFFLLNKRRRL